MKAENKRTAEPAICSIQQLRCGGDIGWNGGSVVGDGCKFSGAWESGKYKCRNSEYHWFKPVTFVLQAVRAINCRRCGELREFFTNISAEILSVIDSSRSPSFCRRFERLIVVDAGNWGSSPTIMFNNYICAEILSVIDSSQSPSFCRRSELICKLFYFCSKGAPSIEQQQVLMRASKEYGAQEIKRWILFDPKFCVETWHQET